MHYAEYPVGNCGQVKQGLARWQRAQRRHKASCLQHRQVRLEARGVSSGAGGIKMVHRELSEMWFAVTTVLLISIVWHQQNLFPDFECRISHKEILSPCGCLSSKESCVKGMVTDVWRWHLVGGFRSLRDALNGDYRLSPHLSLCIPIVEEWLNSYHVALAMIYCLPNSSKDRSQSVRSWGCQMVSPDEPYLFLSWLSPTFSYSIDKPTHSPFPSYLQSTQKMSRKRKREGQRGRQNCCRWRVIKASIAAWHL